MFISLHLSGPDPTFDTPAERPPHQQETRPSLSRLCCLLWPGQGPSSPPPPAGGLRVSCQWGIILCCLSSLRAELLHEEQRESLLNLPRVAARRLADIRGDAARSLSNQRPWSGPEAEGSRHELQLSSCVQMGQRCSCRCYSNFLTKNAQISKQEPLKVLIFSYK